MEKILEYECMGISADHKFAVEHTGRGEDISPEFVMCSHPVETVHGGRHGCVRVADGYYLNHRFAVHKALNQKQTDLLRKLRDQLVGDDRDTINSILVQFAP